MVAVLSVLLLLTLLWVLEQLRGLLVQAPGHAPVFALRGRSP
jgi:hypothetical protein